MRVHELDSQELYKKGMTLREGEYKTVAHNTKIRRDGDWIYVRFHATDIAAITPTGSVMVNSGGWTTPTTQTRLNCLMPGRVNICQRQWKWYFWKIVDGTVVETPYADYAMVQTDGTVWLGKERIL